MGSTLTFGDVTLSADDLTLVQPPNWLNDNLLTFWGQYLVGKLMSDGERLPGEVVFVPPNLSFFLSLCEGACGVERGGGWVRLGLGLKAVRAV